MDVFIIIKRNEEGILLSRDERLKDLNIDKTNKSEIFQKYIDLRLFGATIAVDKSKDKQEKSKEKGWSITATGPVQFNIGRSFNKVKVETIKGTTVMPSEAGKTQGTFTETSIVNYSLIGFHGFINENAAKQTLLNESDIDLLFESLWNGTKNLITRSKAGQEPRVLLQIVYKEKEFHIGDLHRLIKVTYSKDELSIRDIQEITFDFSELIKVLFENKQKIEKIRIKIDPRINSTDNLEELIKQQIALEQFNF